MSKWFEKTGIETLMNENDLNGTERVLLSNLLTQEECEKLVQLAVVRNFNVIYFHSDTFNGRVVLLSKLVERGRVQFLLKLVNLAIQSFLYFSLKLA